MKRVPYTTGNGVLVPASDEAREQLARLGEGERVTVEIVRPRSTKFNAAVHLTLERVARAMGIRRGFAVGTYTMRALYGWLMVKTGRAEVVSWQGYSVVVPHSASDMSELEFESFWEDASAVITADVLPFVDASEAIDIANRLAAPLPVEDRQTGRTGVNTPPTGAADL